MSADFHFPAFVVSMSVVRGRPPRMLMEESQITEQDRRNISDTYVSKFKSNLSVSVL